MQSKKSPDCSKAWGDSLGADAVGVTGQARASVETKACEIDFDRDDLGQQ